MSKAFPGIRGISVFNNPIECVDRLEIVLRNPLNAKKVNMQDPIWWFRGSSSMNIAKFKRLASTKFLMNENEIEVKRLIVYAAEKYFKKFIYVESLPEESVYEENTKELIDYMVKETGVCLEEYAIFRDKVITREEYDDGAVIINGKVIDLADNAELRCRYLSPYNFIICAKWNPLNGNDCDLLVENTLDGMLKGTKNIDVLVKNLEKLPKYELDRRI